MKKISRVISLIMIAIIIIVTLSSCNAGEGVPFLTTKSSTTTVVNTVSVTFPEGYTIVDMAEKLEANKVCSAADFMAVCNEPYEGIEIDNADERVFLLEGYVFPDTYEFYFNSDAKSVLDKFIDNYNSKITDEIKSKATALGYTMDEMLTLASIIQKECDEDIAECATVSSVFHNRLKNPSFPKLQSDVTTFYIKDDLGEYLGYNSESDISSQSEKVRRYMNLYSTYYCNGLPAGPICNPGIKAINAAVNPAETDYLYFLTDAAGKKFYYATTIAEHQANGKAAGLF